MGELRFCWWNVCDYVHFDPTRAARRGWPKTQSDFDEKHRRVVDAFVQLFGSALPDLVGLCEVTPTAARRLQADLFPEHEVFPTGTTVTEGTQVVVLFRRGVGFTPGLPISADRVSVGTRSMPVLNFVTGATRLQFVFVHWTAMDKSSSRSARQNLAVTLSDHIYEHVRTLRVSPNVVVIGDFNQEPFDPVFEEQLFARRNRALARSKPHGSDRSLRRIRLYNCGWRLLGEIHPHTAGGVQPEAAGTYFQGDADSVVESHWRTFDQVLVTGGLLSSVPPYLDEARLRVHPDTGNLVDGLPAKFRDAKGVAEGLSDHLPLSGVIVLP